MFFFFLKLIHRQHPYVFPLAQGVQPLPVVLATRVLQKWFAVCLC